MTEWELITTYFKPLEKIKSLHPAAIGIGDDGAVLDVPPGYQLVVSTDNLIQDVHFPATMPAYDIGIRSLAVNLSDLAAMGAQPLWFSLNINLPKINHLWLQDFSAGLNQIATNFDCQLIGGNTCSGQLNIAITIYGIVPYSQAIQATTANIGDHIYVTGYLGNAYGGLQCLQHNCTHQYPQLTKSFKHPTPRIDIGLAIRGIASSATDLSDGLVLDLPKMLHRQKLDKQKIGANIRIDKLAVSDELIQYLGLKEARLAAITGGDDYELCLTVSPKRAKTLEKVLSTYSTPVNKIGEVIAQQNIYYLTDDKQIDIPNNTYTHF